MASRNFNRLQALTKEVKHLHTSVSIGAAGAATLNTKLGVASINKDNTGEYTITLDDKYTKLLNITITHESTTAEDSSFQVKSSDVSGQKSITFFTKLAGAAADLSDGSKLHISIELKNSSVGE